MHHPTTSTLTAFLSLLSLSSASAIPTAARDAAPAELPRVSGITYSGDGCPSSNPRVDRLGTWDDLAFRFNAFSASLPGVTTASSNCQVHLQVSGASQGWQLGIKDVYVKGHLVLDPGARFDYFVQTFWSQDAGDTTTVRGTLPNTGAGRLDADVTAHTTIPAADINWSPCSASSGYLGILNVNFRAALTADANDYAYFGRDSDTTPTESWGYAWRKC